MILSRGINAQERSETRRCSGRLTSARESLTNRYLPLGLSSDAKLIKPIAKDTYVTYDDVELDETSLAFKIRKTMEDEYRQYGLSDE
jgi:predicted homoserine dehydrogenase-like protein